MNLAVSLNSRYVYHTNSIITYLLPLGKFYALPTRSEDASVVSLIETQIQKHLRVLILEMSLFSDKAQCKGHWCKPVRNTG